MATNGPAFQIGGNMRVRRSGDTKVCHLLSCTNV